MKALKLALAAAFLLGASQASALFDVSAFGGYTTVNLSAVNDTFDQGAAGYSASSYGLKDNTRASGGYYVGADAAISVFPFIKIGPRFEYVGVGQAKVGDNNGDYHSLDSSIMLYELGVSTDISLPLTGLSIQGGIWGGYGLALASETYDIPGASIDATLPLSGSGFVGELAVQARYKIIPLISIGLDLGYRLAKINEMDYGSTSPELPFSGAYQGTDGKAAAFDFSGLNIGGNISFNF